MSGSSAPNRPIVSVKIRPRDGDIRRLYDALVIERDPNIRIVLDPDSQEISVLGSDENQLEQVTAAIRRKFGLALEVGEPEVIYLETIRQHAEAEGKYIRQTGGSGNYGHVKIRLEPNEPNKGFEFIDAIKGGVVPKKYIKPTEQGIREALQNGVLAGYEMVDFKVTLFDGSYHDVDSNEMAFKIAGSMAFKEAAKKASPVLLEPIVAIEIEVPKEYSNRVHGEIVVNRRGRVSGMEYREKSAVIHAIVPLAEMLGYRPNLTMQFLRYSEVPSPDEYGDNEAGVIARTPRGPKPKYGFTTLPEPE